MILASSIKINKMITGSNNFTLRNVNVKPCEFDKMYIDKDLTEDKLQQITDEVIGRKITPVKFYSILLNKESCIGYAAAVQPHQIVPLSR